MLGTLTQEEIEDFLHEQYVGRIGCHAEGRTYVVPVTYVYDGNAIYAHSVDGLKLRMMRANPQVCFEVDHMIDMANWRSVITWGTFEELSGNDANRALAMLVTRLLPVIASETATLAGSLGVDEHHLARVRGRRATPFPRRVSERTGRIERRRTDT